MSDRPGMTYVDTPAACERLCAQLDAQPWLALDTEFIREDTYYARLCLIQIATPDRVTCVDPLPPAVALDPLLARIYDPAVRKVLHASHQDLEIFYHLRQGRLPAPIFDTQLAAALLGWPSQSSYATLVKDVLGVELNKAHARTDWSRRPLSPAQLDYAADDVRYLGPLHLELEQRLAAAGRLDWLLEDCGPLSDPTRYVNAPGDAWRRIRGTQHLTPRQLDLLQALAAWREQAACSEDRPRGWLLRDEALLEIACKAPEDLSALADLASIPRKAAERYGRTVIDLVRKANGRTVVSADSLAAARGAPTKEEKAMLKRMTDLVRTRAEELSVDPTAIAARKDLLGLMHGDTSPSLLQGWRKTVVGDDLIALLGSAGG